ncbi:hypothetical protein [Thioclava sp. GXIMD2076]|uniref:hypothetical protein n=1 Tax=Thioclava sp. GXIMD2076 TaxID=3131931 RepID=UPI0030CECBCA
MSLDVLRKKTADQHALVRVGEDMQRLGWELAFDIDCTNGALIAVTFGPDATKLAEAGTVLGNHMSSLDGEPEADPEKMLSAGQCLPGDEVADLHSVPPEERASPFVTEHAGMLTSVVLAEEAGAAARGPVIGDIPDEASDSAGVEAPEAKAETGVSADAEYLTGSYSAGELEKLAQLYGAGKTVPEIAKVLGRRNQSVGSKIKYMIANGQLADREAAPAPAPVVAEPEPVLSPEALSYLGKLKGLKADPAFDAVTELAMCKALLDGQKQNMVAADLAIDGKAMMKRFRLICGSAIGTGKMATEALIEALQYRADREVA